MPAQLIDGKKLADEILIHLKKQISGLKKRPGLAAVLVGDNPASQMYLKLKEKACHKVGIDFHSYFIDADCSEKQILEVINFLNNDPEITGTLVQLPLPKGIDTDEIIQAIDPAKDVDGFQPQSKFTSPNILGIMELIKSTGVDLRNKRVVVLSNSEKFAKPLKKLLPQSQVNYLDPKTPSSKLNAQCQTSDILIVAIGQPHFIKPNMIKKDAILIDVGINKIKDKTVGDIDPACDKVAAFRSPVPSGVGPMTVAMLLKNLASK